MPSRDRRLTHAIGIGAGLGDGGKGSFGRGDRERLDHDGRPRPGIREGFRSSASDRGFDRR